MTKGVLFDKDGTLFEFGPIWHQATVDFLATVTAKVANPIDLATKLGMVDGVLQGNSILTSGTPYELAHELVQAKIFNSQQSAEKFVKEFFYDFLVNNLDNVKSIGDLPALIKKLHALNYKVGIVTSDEVASTMTTLKHAGVSDLFDFIATSDDYPTKPDPTALYQFCEQLHLDSQDVIVVGDSIMDIQLGNQAAAGVAVLSGTGVRADFEELTPYIYNDIQSIPYQKILENDV